MNSKLNRVETEYQEIEQKLVWTLIFQTLSNESLSSFFTFEAARLMKNKPLNRYRDVNPFDHTRIVIHAKETDYINANLVTLERAARKYILTQGPLSYTVDHFWLMMWEQNSRTIVMLNKVIEKNEIKCHWYWPSGKKDETKMTLAGVKLTIELVSEKDHKHYAIRVFKVQHMETEEIREIVQYHYVTWPDFGVPSSPFAFLEFHKTAVEAGALDCTYGPPVVHCSAGIGRSGTFCLVDSCLVIIEKEGIENLNVQQVLLELRQSRMGLIQTPEQLRFSYQAIIEGAKRMDPNYVPVKTPEENIYYPVNIGEVEIFEDDGPPLPPPRGTSLVRPPCPPARPLPAIPSSSSLGNLVLLPPPHEKSRLGKAALSAKAAASKATLEEVVDEENTPEASGSGESSELRNRKKAEMSERVSAMKKRARETEKWHSFKRSLYKPLTFTFGVLIAGILVYTYVKH